MISFYVISIAKGGQPALSQAFQVFSELRALCCGSGNHLLAAKRGAARSDEPLKAFKQSSRPSFVAFRASE